MDKSLVSSAALSALSRAFANEEGKYSEIDLTKQRIMSVGQVLYFINGFEAALDGMLTVWVVGFPNDPQFDKIQTQLISKASFRGKVKFAESIGLLTRDEAKIANGLYDRRNEIAHPSATKPKDKVVSEFCDDVLSLQKSLIPNMENVIRTRYNEIVKRDFEIFSGAKEMKNG
jgi:hypothetical protein